MTKHFCKFLFCAGALAIPAMAQTQVVIDLKAASNSVNPMPSTLIPGVTLEQYGPLPVSGNGSVTGCGAGWNRARVKLDLAVARAKQANITVEYEGAPKGWTAHVTGSPDMDGYGGSGDLDAPEFHITSFADGDRLLGYSRPYLGQGVDNLIDAQVNVKDSAVKLMVSKQRFAFGQPLTVLNAPISKTLFAADPNDPQNGAVWASFNRVVSGNASRNGCGARRVIISFE